MLQKSLNTALHLFNWKLPFLSVSWVLSPKMMSTVNFSYKEKKKKKNKDYEP